MFAKTRINLNRFFLCNFYNCMTIVLNFINFIAERLKRANVELLESAFESHNNILRSLRGFFSKTFESVAKHTALEISTI